MRNASRIGHSQFDFDFANGTKQTTGVSEHSAENGFATLHCVSLVADCFRRNATHALKNNCYQIAQ